MKLKLRSSNDCVSGQHYCIAACITFIMTLFSFVKMAHIADFCPTVLWGLDAKCVKYQVPVTQYCKNDRKTTTQSGINETLKQHQYINENAL